MQKNIYAQCAERALAVTAAVTEQRGLGWGGGAAGVRRRLRQQRSALCGNTAHRTASSTQFHSHALRARSALVTKVGSRRGREGRCSGAGVRRSCGYRGERGGAGRGDDTACRRPHCSDGFSIRDICLHQPLVSGKDIVPDLT